jgi:hypothetical protein
LDSQLLFCVPKITSYSALMGVFICWLNPLLIFGSSFVIGFELVRVFFRGVVEIWILICIFLLIGLFRSRFTFLAWFLFLVVFRVLLLIGK